jgi:ABC-type phosphate transport system substrate-binding protein
MRSRAGRALRRGLAGFLLLPTLAGAQDAYQVVVNAQNPVSELPRAEVSRMFLKQSLKWGDGKYVVPVDQSANSATRAAFCNGVHKRTPEAVQSYWQKEIFGRRTTPPFVKVGDDAVVAFVAGNAAGIGYVSGTASLPAGVKALRLKD